mgnify:CR=1 FL=1|tara:strand:- start:707 stop:1168 length:462 start_codon:yes stop_codon:yes gene_type:complete
METFHPPKNTDETKDNDTLPEIESLSDKWLLEKLDNLIPLIQERWPSIAKQTIEASKGKIDDLVNIISNHTGNSSTGIKDQLFEIIDSVQTNNWEFGEHIAPLENQLEELLDELNKTLRPKIESPIRKKPILSIAIAAGIGILIGSILTNGRK